MSDMDEMRYRISSQERSRKFGQILFYICLALIPIVGLAGGVWVSLVKTAKADAAEIAETMAADVQAGGTAGDDAFDDLPLGRQWLLLQAAQERDLAIALSIADEYPEALALQQYMLVVRRVMTCANMSDPDDPTFRTAMDYTRTNDPRRERAAQLFQTTGASERFYQAVGVDAFLGAFGIGERNFVTRKFAEIEQELNAGAGAAGGSMSPACRTVMTLAGRGALDLNL